MNNCANIPRGKENRYGHKPCEKAEVQVRGRMAGATCRRPLVCKSSHSNEKRFHNSEYIDGNRSMRTLDGRPSRATSSLSAMRRRNPRFVSFLLFLGGLFLFILILQYTISSGNREDTSSLESSARQQLLFDANGKRKKVILMWTPVFLATTATLADCPLRDSCLLTFDQKMLPDADAVVFHMNPTDFSWSSIPTKRLPQHRYVFLLQEAPHQVYTDIFVDVVPGFFNWTMTYRLDSDVPMPYGGWWIRPEEKSNVDPGALSNLSLSYDKTTVLAQKTGFILWLVSNCRTPSKREFIVDALKEQGIQVDMIGACAPAEDKRIFCPKTDAVDKCAELYPQYKFFIAFENAICKDYITEKYWNRWNSMSVPIVMRRKTYESRIPAGSFIAVDDFKNPSALADHLRYLNSNDTAYMEYFEWRNEGYDRAQWNGPGYRLGYCRLCEKLLKDEPPSVVADINSWFKENSECERNEFADVWVHGRYRGYKGQKKSHRA